VGGLSLAASARLYAAAQGGSLLPRPAALATSLLALLAPRSLPALAYSAATLALAGAGARGWPACSTHS
jgi:hypothetical protein